MKVQCNVTDETSIKHKSSPGRFPTEVVSVLFDVSIAIVNLLRDCTRTMWPSLVYAPRDHMTPADGPPVGHKNHG